MYLSKCQFTLIENIRWSNDWQTKTLIYEVFVCVLSFEHGNNFYMP